MPFIKAICCCLVTKKVWTVVSAIEKSELRDLITNFVMRSEGHIPSQSSRSNFSQSVVEEGDALNPMHNLTVFPTARERKQQYFSS